MTASERAIEAASVPLEGEVAAYAGLERWALADRWRIYARLREEAPVYGFGNSALITRYDDVIAVLMDKERVHNGGPSHGVPADVLARLSAGERELLDEIIDWEERWLTSVNGARHTELRGLGQRVFSPRVIPDIERDPRATLLFEAGDSYRDYRGAMLECDVRIHRGEGDVRRVGWALAARYDPDAIRHAIDAQAAKRVAREFVVRRRSSYDHRMLPAGVY